MWKILKVNDKTIHLVPVAVFLASFEHISHPFLVFLLLTLNWIFAELLGGVKKFELSFLCFFWGWVQSA